MNGSIIVFVLLTLAGVTMVLSLLCARSGDRHPIIGCLQYFAPKLPLFLVYIVGLVVALIRWHKYPRVSALTCMAVGVMFCHWAMIVWPLPSFFHYLETEIGWNARQYGFVVYNSLIAAIVLFLLLGAVFVDRSQRPQTDAQPLPSRFH